MRAAPPGLCLMVLAGLVAAAVVAGADRARAPHPGLAPCAAPDSPAKPSSYAPHPRSRSRTYGAPIQRPIVAKHGKRRARTGSHRGGGPQADRRGG